MSTTQSRVINLPEILKFLKATDAEKNLVKERINNLDANLIELLNNVFKFKGEELKRWIVAFSNCSHFQPVFFSGNKDESYDDDDIRNAFLSFLLFTGNDPKLLESFKSMNEKYRKFYQGICESDYLDKNEVRPDNVEAVDAIIRVYGKTNGETGKIIAELRSNKFVIDKVSGLFGCDLARFVKKEMEKSRLIGFVEYIINIKIDYALDGKRCFHYETLIKALYILWILDKNIDRFDDRVYSISCFFGADPNKDFGKCLDEYSNGDSDQGCCRDCDHDSNQGCCRDSDQDCDQDWVIVEKKGSKIVNGEGSEIVEKEEIKTSWLGWLGF